METLPRSTVGSNRACLGAIQAYYCTIILRNVQSSSSEKIGTVAISTRLSLARLMNTNLPSSARMDIVKKTLPKTSPPKNNSLN